MSATGRNLVGNERRADDFYATPAWCTRAILPHLRPPHGPVSGKVRVLDPCAGTGAILDIVRDEWGCLTYGIELDEQRAAVARVGCFDALREGWPQVDLVITNPPYTLAASFIAMAQEYQAGRGESAFLLRLNYLGSQKRAAFHRQYPADIYVLPRRPSFTGGGTDATEYAWFVWGPGRGGRWSILDVEAA